VFVTHSADEGVTWAPPRDITAEVRKPNTTWDAVGPGNGIALAGRCGKGTLMIPAIGRNLISADKGKTWKASAPLPGGTSETTLVEPADGSLMRNDRPVNKVLTEAKRRPVSVSTDCGVTWSPWRSDPGLPTTQVRASLIRMGAQPGPGDILIFSNPRSLENRRQMTLRLSEDGGKTWVASREIHAGTAGYSSLAELANSAIGLLYEKGRNDAKSQSTIVFSRMALRWLAEGRSK
jgi:sialidase-1